MNTQKYLSGLLLVIFLASCAPGLSPTADFSIATPVLPPGVTATIPPTRTATSTPTPTPEVRVANADLALFNGDYPSARVEYQAAYLFSANPEIQKVSLWGLGRTEYEDGNYAAALTFLRSLTTDFPETSEAARAWLLLGFSYDALERYTEAASAYSNYLALRPGRLDAYVEEWRGDSLSNAGDTSGAITAYETARTASRSGSRTSLEIKIAGAYAATGDTATAIRMYDEIEAEATYDSIKAQMELLAGRVYLNLGQSDQAYQRFLNAVYNYPLTYESYSALVALVDADVPVDELSRGLVDYYVGQYDVALGAFNRYETANPQNDGSVYYYRGLTLYELGYTQDAILDWSYLIDHYTGSRYWEAAWEAKADAQWMQSEDYTGAAQTLLGFVAYTPSNPSASRFLLNAGRMYERGGMLEEAASTWERLAEEYPSSDVTPLGLFWAGIARYRNGSLDAALVTFQRGLLLATTPDDQARAYFWIGKTQQAKGNPIEAQTAWKQAAGLDPTGYYSERARDTLLGRTIFEPPPAYEIVFDKSAERADAEAWIRITFSLAPDTNLGEAGELLNDARLQRGTELWKLGLYDDARLEFEELRQAVNENPADSYRLGNYMLDLGLYRSAFASLQQVLRLAGMDTYTKMLTAPDYFNHVRYGTYYPDLVTRIAGEYNLDPLFMWSVVWQESLFEGFVRSSAGAHGLMQIIPDTGASLAESIGWPLDYTTSDLYRPIVSLTYGTHYLAANRDRFNGDLYAGLAAYNGGPGNAGIWNQLAGGDPDLFVEIIRFEETRNYIRNIYEVFVVYRSLYGTVP